MPKTVKKDVNLTPEEAAYISGIIDGEGSILMYKNGNKDYYTKKRYSLVARIIVVNTNRNIILYLKKKLGGFVQKRSKEKRFDGKAKDIYVWIAGITQIRKFLPFLMPYSIIKKNHWKQIKKFINLPRKKNTGLFGHFDDDTFRKVKKLYATLKILNQRGNGL